MSMPRRKKIFERHLCIDHRWIAILIIIPLLITTITGVLLLLNATSARILSIKPRQTGWLIQSHKRQLLE